MMTLKSYSAFVGYVSHVEVDYTLAGWVTIVAVLGTVIGTRFSQKVNPQDLRKGFAWFVLAMAAFVIGKEASPFISAAVIIPAASWMGYRTRQNRQADS